MNIKSNFPFPSFTGHQEKTLDRIGDFLDSHKYVLVNAPTGAGKSPISMSVARSFESCHILTPVKSLQDQYARDFSQYLTLIKGKGSYPCNADANATCSNGPCKGKKSLSCYQTREVSCEFYIALVEAQNAPIVLHNFHSFLYQVNLARYFEQRDVLIVDECHNIEKILMDYVSFRITPAMIGGKIIPKKSNMKDYITIIEDAHEEMKTIYKDKTSRMKESDPHVSKLLAKETEDIEKVIQKVSFFLNQVNRDPDNWVFNSEIDQYDMVKYLEIKPVMINQYVDKLLFQYGKKIVCLSATIDPESFCRSLGINRDELAYIEIPSTFPVENRPIYKDYIGSINFKTLKGLLPTIADRVQGYLDMFPNDKGIIHTQTFEISKYIRNHVKSDRLIFHDNEYHLNRDEALDLHCTVSDPTVLVSPSMAEGVDLKDDLARFCVIVKVPYGYIGDRQIKARMDKDYLWYVSNTITTIQQMAGRVVRTEKDHGETFILDSAFEKLLRQHGRLFNGWFLSAIKDRDVEVQW